jgi:hypothetical protein
MRALAVGALSRHHAPMLLLAFAACTAPDTDKTEEPADDTSPPEPSFCEVNDFGDAKPWNATGPYGTVRHELAEDFSLPLTDGTTWTLSEQWTGCESYLFIPDDIPVSSTDSTSVWNKHLGDLIEESPRNTHYFFIATERDADESAAVVADMDDRIADALADLDEEDAAWWAGHLHVVSGRAQDLGSWVEGTLLRGIGTGGFGIDQFQAIRGMGGLSDVDQYDAAAGSWPYDSRIAYAAHDARFFNMEAARQARLDAESATVVPLWTGEVIEQYAEMDVDLPSAADMAGFDTFEIDIDMRCPDPDSPEYGNCGAWDYIASFSVEEDDGSYTELGRFITSYHRETHWVLDATPMMVHLLAGGTRHFKWEWAPEWNTQPTETRINLRFSNQGKGMAPREATYLYSGGSFGSTYNDGREPMDVPIPATAQKVELWTIVTGHGAGTNSCAEFCNHQHEFTVNGNVHLDEFPGAGVTPDGCVDEVENQSTPNQWGTWWYGRGGWCPGQQVKPYVVDVTGEVTPGTDATVSYRGLYDGDTPPDGSGDIVLNSWLVVYE